VVVTESARRQQQPITIRSSRAAELLRQLVGPGHSQAEVIEDALEQFANRRMSLLEALTPREPLDFKWEPAHAMMTPRDVEFTD
jgi:hypothetical protein